MNESVEPGDWKFRDFYHNSTFVTRQYDKYTLEIVDYGDSLKIVIRGIDNGIYVDYIFRLVNDKWMLVRMDDFNM